MIHARILYCVAFVALQIASGVPAQESLPVAVEPQSGTAFFDDLRDGGRGPEMVILPAGDFEMGCISGVGCFDDQKPVHQVKISKPLAVSRFEITFEEYERFADPTQLDDEGWGRGRRPAVNVSWDDAKQYVTWLSVQTGQAYRLLTEAEWEYAARAGSKSRFHFGDNESRLCDFANSWDIEAGNPNAPCSDGVGMQTSDVGNFLPNAFGLHDMHGNVYEWVEDCWNASYSGAPSDGSAWVNGDCSKRVLRSSSLLDYPKDSHTAIRVRFAPDLRNGVSGFRVARTLAP